MPKPRASRNRAFGSLTDLDPSTPSRNRLDMQQGVTPDREKQKREAGLISNTGMKRREGAEPVVSGGPRKNKIVGDDDSGNMDEVEESDQDAIGRRDEEEDHRGNLESRDIIQIHAGYVPSINIWIHRHIDTMPSTSSGKFQGRDQILHVELNDLTIRAGQLWMPKVLRNPMKFETLADSLSQSGYSWRSRDMQRWHSAELWVYRVELGTGRPLSVHSTKIESRTKLPPAQLFAL